MQGTVFLLQPIPAEATLRVAERGSRAQVELPEMLEARQDGSVVNPLLERNCLVRAIGLIGEELASGIDDEDSRPGRDGTFLHAARRDFIDPTYWLPHACVPSRGSSRRHDICRATSLSFDPSFPADEDTRRERQRQGPIASLLLEPVVFG